MFYFIFIVVVLCVEATTRHDQCIWALTKFNYLYLFHFNCNIARILFVVLLEFISNLGKLKNMADHGEN